MSVSGVSPTFGLTRSDWWPSENIYDLWYINKWLTIVIIAQAAAPEANLS